MRHVLVTGGAGFIGSHLVDRLLSEGWRVTVVDDFNASYDPALKEKNVEPHLRDPNYVLVRADICDAETLESSLTGDYDAIVHFAARAGVRSSVADPVTYYEINIRGTQNLLDLARKWGVRQWVFASSSSVYGVNPSLPWKEESALLPVSPYGATKVAGELLGHVYSQLYDMRFVALRLFSVYGPRQRPDLAIRKFVGLMLEGKPVSVYGDGNSSRDYTFIDDVIDGIVAAITYAESKYEVINLGSGCPVKLKDLVEAIAEELGVRALIKHLPGEPGDAPHTHADISKASRLLGYCPKTGLRTGLNRFLRSLGVGGGRSANVHRS